MCNITFHNSINEDYSKYCITKLQEVDPTYSETDIRTTMIDYHRYKFRKINESPRTVHVSNTFTCFSEFENTYNDIIRKIENGEPLRPYQSRKLKDTDYDDAMLMDWGVQHLHLGDNLQPDGFIQRTNELLFVRFTNTDAYIINIFEHDNWTDLEVLEIIHNNWPQSIEDFLIKDAVDLAFSPEKEDLKQLRKAQINSAVKLSDGSIYMGPGMGVTTAGSPLISTRNVLRLQKLFKRSFDHIVKNHKDIFTSNNIEFDQERLTIGLRLENKQLVYMLKELNLGIILDK